MKSAAGRRRERRVHSSSIDLRARGTGTTSVADYCAQEEMSRYTGYWPSPGEGKSVAFEEVDSVHPEFTIMNQACPIAVTTRPTATHLPGPPIPR